MTHDGKHHNRWTSNNPHSVNERLMLDITNEAPLNDEDYFDALFMPYVLKFYEGSSFEKNQTRP